MTIWLQKYQNDQLRLGREEKLVYQHALMNEIPVRYFTQEELFSETVDLNECELLVGSVECVIQALKIKGTPEPKSNYYPESLRKYLLRDIWKGHPADVVRHIAFDTPIFSKPFAWKLFTGQIFDQTQGYSLISELKDNEQLWLSEIVNFKYEFRAYVIDHQLVKLCQYTGEEDKEPNIALINKAIEDFRLSGSAPKAYAFDWGITEGGDTAMVEFNEGFAIGAYYDISPKDYYTLLKTRWDELVLNKPINKKKSHIL